jgi:hypothetical protein
MEAQPKPLAACSRRVLAARSTLRLHALTGFLKLRRTACWVLPRWLSFQRELTACARRLAAEPPMFRDVPNNLCQSACRREITADDGPSHSKTARDVLGRFADSTLVRAVCPCCLGVKVRLWANAPDRVSNRARGRRSAGSPGVDGVVRRASSSDQPDAKLVSGKSDVRGGSLAAGCEGPPGGNVQTRCVRAASVGAGTPPPQNESPATKTVLNLPAPSHIPLPARGRSFVGRSRNGARRRKRVRGPGGAGLMLSDIPERATENGQRARSSLRAGGHW